MCQYLRDIGIAHDRIWATEDQAYPTLFIDGVPVTWTDEGIHRLTETGVAKVIDVLRLNRVEVPAGEIGMDEEAAREAVRAETAGAAA